MIPFEFSVIGVPVSVQTRNRQRLHQWQTQVRNSALAYWPAGDPPQHGDLILTIVYYYDGVPLDTDNIVKPIQDALVDLVYPDDRTITDIKACKRSINGSFRVRGMSVAIAQGFSSNQEFVYVKIDRAPDPQELII